MNKLKSDNITPFSKSAVQFSIFQKEFLTSKHTPKTTRVNYNNKNENLTSRINNNNNNQKNKIIDSIYMENLKKIDLEVFSELIDVSIL